MKNRTNTDAAKNASAEKKSWTRKARERSLLQDTKGMNTVEYAILLVLIVVISYGVWQKFGHKVKSGVERANSTVELKKAN